MSRIANDVVELVFWGAVVAYTLRPVSRERLERFARRQELVITVDNGPIVLDYLASTRRWRVAGLIVGAAFSFGFGYTQHSDGGGFGGAATLLGWFAGALVAEWRMQNRHPQAGRRVASLVARRFVGYLPKPLLVLDAVAWAAALVLGVGALAFGPLPTGPALVGLGFAGILVPATVVVARRILTRAQTVTAPDQLAADDALRSRSLHVLAGSTLALNGLLCALFASQTVDFGGHQGWLSSDVANGVQMVGTFLLPIVGWSFAMSRFATRREAIAPGRKALA